MEESTIYVFEGLLLAPRSAPVSYHFQCKSALFGQFCQTTLSGSSLHLSYRLVKFFGAPDGLGERRKFLPKIPCLSVNQEADPSWRRSLKAAIISRVGVMQSVRYAWTKGSQEIMRPLLFARAFWFADYSLAGIEAGIPLTR